MRIGDFFRLIITVGVLELAGVFGALFTRSAIPTWYATLQKPALNPPSWIFGPVWAALYALMGISLFLVWSSHAKTSDGQTKQYSHILTAPRSELRSTIGENMRMLRMWKISIAAFFIQLFLNAVWSPIFFGLHSPGWALVDIVVLWPAVVWTISAFYKLSKSAAYLLFPYILWVSFAVYLNYSIVVLNPKGMACPEDVKLCPDGSYVGRIGPSCQFALCPKEDLIQVKSPR